MPRDPRTYITVHDGMPDHPKIAGLSDAAFRALITGWCWCAKYQTDGLMPRSVWSRLSKTSARTELVAVGLVDEVYSAPQVTFHDYLEHQRSRQEIDDLQRKRASAGAKGGHAKAANVASATASAKQVPKQTPSKAVADTETSTSVVELEKNAYVSNASESDDQDYEPPPVQDEARGPKVSLTVMQIVRAYKAKVSLCNPSNIAMVINAATADYELDVIAKAVKELADDRRTVTPDTLRIELEKLGLPDKKGIVHIQGGFYKDWETGIIRNREDRIIGRDWPRSTVPKFRD